MRNEIGFSTGALHGKDFTLEEKISILSWENISSIELSFWEVNEFLTTDLEPIKDQLLLNFSSVSFHAPWKWITYTDDIITKKVIKKLENLEKDINFSWIVVHPDVIQDFWILSSSWLPFCIENMDKRKIFGTHPEHFYEIIQKYNFWFVLDVEHAYEHDSEMNLAKELLHIMWNKLKHMHVSWCSSSLLHVPTYLSENRNAIEQILSMNLDVPYILEWILDGYWNKD